MRERSLHLTLITASWFFSIGSLFLILSSLVLARCVLASQQNELEQTEKTLISLLNYVDQKPRTRRGYNGLYSAVPRPVYQLQPNSYAISSSSLPQAPLDLKPPPFGILPDIPVSNIGSQTSPNTSCCTVGPRGQTGINGMNGKPGQPGLNGESGLPGRVGYSPCLQSSLLPCPGCPKGITGPPGIKGEKGNPGASGELGQDGLPAPNGLHGLPGSRGVAGRVGIPGAKGDQGQSPDASPAIPGPPGETGESGEIGEPGDGGKDVMDDVFLIGQKGRKGDTGLPGSVGMAGQVGPPGDPGGLGGLGICPTYCAVDGGAFHEDDKDASFAQTIPKAIRIISNGNYDKTKNDVDLLI